MRTSAICCNTELYVLCKKKCSSYLTLKRRDLWHCVLSSCDDCDCQLAVCGAYGNTLTVLRTVLMLTLSLSDMFLTSFFYKADYPQRRFSDSKRIADD